MRKNTIYANLILALALICAICAGAFLSITFKASASNNSTRVLPISALESYPLSSPINTYIDEEVTAIIQANNSLLVYKDGDFTLLSKEDKGFTALKHVERFDGDNLIFSDNGIVYLLSLNNFSVSQLTYNHNGQTKTVGGVNFSFNGNYLATTYGTNLLVCKVVDKNDISMVYEESGIKIDSPVALNSNSVFYVNHDGKICYKNFSTFIETPAEIYAISPDKMIAGENAIYYILDEKVYSLSIDGSTNLELAFPISQFELGKVFVPTDVTFYNDNLIVTDQTNDCVQEFSIDNEQLTFTGFAIAKGKTAYNRIYNAVCTEKIQNKLAVLDQNKLTIIDTENLDYSTSSFTNLFVNQPPKLFALAPEKLLCVMDDNSAFIYDLTSNQQTSISIGAIIKDVCYKNGYFFALTSNSETSTVYTIDTTICEVIKTKEYSANYELLEVDAYNNFLLGSDTHVYIDKNLEDGSLQLLFERNGITKILSDLSGRLFLCDGNKISTYNPLTSTIEEIQLGYSNVCDFALSVDTSTVYFVLNDSEHVYSTTSLNNLSIQSVIPPSDLKLTSNTADINDLKVCSILDGANVYEVALENTSFSFKNFAIPKEQYVFIKEILVDQNANLSMYLIADQDGIYLVDKLLSSIEDASLSTAPNEAFVTTTVHAYYLPVISKDLDFALSNDDGNLVILEKPTKILPTKLVSVLGMDFYYCTTPGSNYYFYVPKNFTVEILSQNKAPLSFTIQEIRATTIYLDKELTTKICDIPSATIRLFHNENGVATIQYLDGDVWVDGYVDSSALINAPNLAVRNILIVLAVITSLCGTASFFILKKYS